VDPIAKAYPWYTPYQFAGNKPIVAIDLDGLEEFIIHQTMFENSKGNVFLYRIDFRFMPKKMRGNTDPNTYLIDNDNSISGIMSTTYDKEFLKKHTKKFSRQDGINAQSYLRAVKAFLDQGGNFNQNVSGVGSDIIKLKATMNFSDDQGLYGPEINAAFNASAVLTQDAIDKMVGTLINDPNSTLLIEAFASPKASNLQNTTPLSKDNNILLAQARAENTKNFILEYAYKYYKGAIIDPSRIKINSGIRNSDSSTGDNSNEQVDRSVNITLIN
jgi:hypothetical protein